MLRCCEQVESGGHLAAISAAMPPLRTLRREVVLPSPGGRRSQVLRHQACNRYHLARQLCAAAAAWCPATSVAGPPCSKPHGTPIKTTAALVTGLVLVNVSANKSIPKNVSDVAAALGLRDAARFDFRPRLPQSPLVAAGVQVPPFTNSEPVPAGSASIDCGAYQAHDEAAAGGAAAATTAWVPGCTFRPECAP